MSLISKSARVLANHKGMPMTRHHCNEGLDDRCRDENGRIRQKRSDTLVGTLRDEYGPDFAAGFRSHTKLGTVRDEIELANSCDQVHVTVCGSTAVAAVDSRLRSLSFSFVV